MTTRHIKTSNLSCRVSGEHKQLIERAANISGFSTSEFIVHTLVTAAADVLRDESVIRLTREDWDKFTTSLDRPAREPGEATRRAVELFRQGRDEGDRQVW